MYIIVDFAGGGYLKKLLFIKFFFIFFLVQYNLALQRGGQSLQPDKIKKITSIQSAWKGLGNSRECMNITLTHETDA